MRQAIGANGKMIMRKGEKMLEYKDGFDRLTSLFAINAKLIQVAKQVNEKLEKSYQKVDDIICGNQAKVLHAFKSCGVTESHLWGSTGYGYNDIGRDMLDEIYAKVFRTESALVRGQFVSGTHAIASCLLALLEPGDTLLFATGMPYDTLHKVVGWEGNSRLSLHQKGVKTEVIPLLPDGKMDIPGILSKIDHTTKMVHFQRSQGYTWRKAFSCSELGRTISKIKEVKSDIKIFVDNCYGEFTCADEPTYLGADLMAGSLIKNPGGGFALWGGYVVGSHEDVLRVSEYCTAPGLGKEMGGTLNVLRSFYQGFFMAPHVVGQALKGAIFTAALCQALGFKTSPLVQEDRYDIIQAIEFDNKAQLIAFCQGVQAASPIDSMAIPEPGPLPGYNHDVIMAAGTFIQGASLEYTADAPLKPPFIGYVQGGLTFEHAKIGILMALNTMIEKQLLKI